MSKSGGRLVVDALLANGVDQVFAVPGESYLPVLDALHDAPQIRLTVARQEGGAAMMAEAHGKLTGKPGICLVTRGPGATNASSGIHVAAQDSTPMIVLIGQVGGDVVDREAFQEVDYKAMFGDQVKWATTVNDTSRLPEYMARAFSVAMSGRKGPVVLALPEDTLWGEADVEAAPASIVSVAAPDPDLMAAFEKKLLKAEQPIMIVGGEGWSGDDVDRLVAFAEAWRLPVATSFRAQDRFPNTHHRYAGISGLGIDPALAARIKSSDLVIALGARLGDCTTQSYTLFKSPVPDQPIVHIHLDPEELGHVYQPELAINSGVSAFLKAAESLNPPSQIAWSDWAEEAHADFLAWTEHPTHVEGDFNLGEAMKWLRERLPEDAIITNGAGNYAIWLHRYYRHRAYRTQLSPTSGSMGYGLPAAVAAKLAAPERTVVCFAGDGCFQMTCQELGTIAGNDLNIIIVVVNNGMYGTIRMHQEREYPGRVSGTGLFNPDFVALAAAYGLNGERITETGQFADAFDRALGAGKATLIEIVTDPRVLSPSFSISE